MQIARKLTMSFLTVVISACADKALAPPRTRDTTLSLRVASVLGADVEAPRSIKVYVGYARIGGEIVNLTNIETSVTTPVQTLSIPVDLAPCVHDAQRSTSGNGVCLLRVDVVLRDENAVTLDSTVVTVDTGFGATSAPVEATVAAVASVTLPLDSGIVAVSDTLNVKAIVKDASGNVLNRAVTYSTSNASVAVASGAIVTGIATGFVKIVATAGGKADTSDVEVAFGWKSLSVGPGSNGPFHTCGIGLNGLGYCWGSNVNGQIGDGNSGNTLLVPTAVNIGPLAQISAGTGTTCAIATSGLTRCWGSNVVGSFGDGTTTNSSTPVPGALGLTLRAVAAGSSGGGSGSRMCGITTADSGFCWGLGTLGNGTITGSLVPVPISGNITWADIQQSFNNVCGLSTSGQGYCWGPRSPGVVGDGSLTGSATVPSPITGGLTLAMIRASGSGACGLTTGGSAYCWGQVMNGLNGTMATFSATPTAVPGGFTFTAIAVEGFTACGVTAARAAFCWGGLIPLGDGAPSTVSATPLPVSGGHSVTQIYGGNHQYCILTPKHIAYCWGSGALGDGTTTQRLVPTRVSNP